MSLLGRCYGWSWAPPHASQRVISSGVPLSHDGYDFAVYRAACTATVPGLYTGKEALPLKVKGSQPSHGFLKCYHRARYPT